MVYDIVPMDLEPINLGHVHFLLGRYSMILRPIIKLQKSRECEIAVRLDNNTNVTKQMMQK